MTRAPAVWLLSAVVGLAALAPTAAGAPVKVRPQPQTRINPAVQLQALSCAGPGECSAVGGYQDGIGDSQGLFVSETGGRWRRAVEAQAPNGAAAEPFKLSAGGGLVAISCPAAGSCVAVGRYTDAHRVDHGAIFTEQRGRWRTGVRLQLPPNAIAPPKPKAAVVNLLGLGGVSCSTVGNCVAVGNYETTAEVWEAMIVVERAGRWSRAIEAPLPVGAPVAGQNAVLLTITCSHAGQCAAAGEYVDRSGHQQSLLVSGAGRRWSVAPAPAAPGDASADPNIIPSAIACAQGGDCAAVGTYLNPLQNSLGLLLDETGGRWGDGTGVALPADAAPAGTVGDQTVVLSAVACPLAGSCTAVGWYFDNYGNGQGLLVGQQGGAWQPGVKVTLPANAVGGLQKQSAGLDSISCPSYGNCLATGVYTDLGYNSQGLLLSEVNGTWQTGVESPLPRNAGGLQYAAVVQSDCTGPGDCTVIGQYNNRRGEVLGFLLSEHGGVWGRAITLRLPPVSMAETRLSLQSILTARLRRGLLAKVRSSRHVEYGYQAVEAGTVAARWYVAAGGRRTLIAAGSARVATPGRVVLRLDLTPAGRARLVGAHSLHVLATASFAPRGRRDRVSGQASFTLR